MPKVEIKFKIKSEATIEDIIANNLELFYKLERAGVKSIQTAVDYLTIVQTYKTYTWIENESKRKETVASQLKVTKKTVQNALNLLQTEIYIKV